MPWLAKHVGLVRGGAWSIWFVRSHSSSSLFKKADDFPLLNQGSDPLLVSSSSNSLHRASSHRTARSVLSSSFSPSRSLLTSNPSLTSVLLLRNTSQVKVQSGTLSFSSPSSLSHESVSFSLRLPPSFPFLSFPSMNLIQLTSSLFFPPFHILSCLLLYSALWSIDLIQLQILQEALRDHPRRNRLTSLQLSLQSAFDLSKCAVVLGFNK